MKTTSKILFFIAVSAIVTLSFTFSSTKQTKASVAEKTAVSEKNEPLGGFVSEDKF